MSAFRYEQHEVDGVLVSEVWGLIGAAPASEDNDKRAQVVTEWVERHTHRAKANGLPNVRVTTDDGDEGHLLHEAWA